MIIANLFDLEFDHSLKEDGFYTASMGVEPKLISYVKNRPMWDGVTLFTERMLNQVDNVKSKYKVAWLLESPGVFPWSIDLIISLEDKFDLILTHNDKLLKRSDKYQKFQVGSLRVKNPNIHKKNKICSMIASTKTFLPGHRLRHQIAETFQDRLDLWGSGYKPFTDKESPLADYMFSLAIMNVSENNYFTEVLNDCFALGTIPIFWGCPNISDFFDSEGIIQFSSINELHSILDSLNENLYFSKYNSIINNFNKCVMYKSTDDSVANILISKFNL